MERQAAPPPMKTVVHYSSGNNKALPFAPVHENSMSRSRSSTTSSTEPDKYNPYQRHEPLRYQSSDGASSSYGSGRAKSSSRLRSPDKETRSLEHQRPRPISTGRMKKLDSVEDPHQVTTAILELREKREQLSQSRRQLKQHSLHSHRAHSLADQEQQQQRAASPRSLNRGEKQATFKLQEAEDRIGTLMQELEELRFFHEIDMEPAAVVPLKCIAGVPRANESPGKRRQFLSPRRLANLDRNTLELETQELQRQVEILMQEKSTLQSKTQLQEQQAKSHSEDANRIQRLEKALKEIRVTLVEQIKDIHHGRAVLTDDYESKLDAMLQKYRETQQDAETLAEEIESQKEKYDGIDEEYEQFREQTKEQLTQLQQTWEEKESAFELQLAESIGQVDSMQQSMEDRDEDSVRLQKDLTRSSLETEKCKRELKDHYEAHTSQLEKLLQERDSKYNNLDADFKAKVAEADIKSQRVSTLEDTNMLQAEKVDLLQKQVTEMEGKHEQNIEALKRTCDSREQHRLDDLVQSQHSKYMDYEERIADTRKQLTLATDRHQTEIEQKEIDLTERMDRTVQDAKHSVRIEYEPKLVTLREELESVQLKYDDALQDTLRCQVQSVGKDRDAAREWERRDALRQGEMERLNDKLDVAVREMTEKDSKVQILTGRLAECEERCQLLLSDLETQHVQEVKARDDVMTQRKAVAKLKTELARKDFEIAEIREDLESKLKVFQDELERAKKEREETLLKATSFEDEGKTRQTMMTQTLEKVQKDLISEQARHESLESERRVEIAKFEGKLSATESTLKEKRVIIEDLEARLLNADEQSSSAGSKLHAVIASLRRDLNTSKDTLVQEHLTGQQKDREINAVKNELETANRTNDLKIAGLEEALSVTQHKLLNVERAKLEHENEMSRVREEHGQAIRSLRSLSTDKEKEVSTEVKRLQDELKDRIDSYELKVSALQIELSENEMESRGLADDIDTLKESLQKMSEEEEKLKASLKDNSEEKEKEIHAKEEEVRAKEEEIEKLKVYLQQAIDVSVAGATDTVTWQQRIEDLKSELEETKLSSTELKSGSRLVVENLEKNLKAKEDAQEDMDRQMEKVVYERAEAIDALEQMIEEVQLRQEEFDSLADILELREEELENAKLIATKALASAQEIKTRYKQRGNSGSDKYNDLQIKIDELNAEVEYLTGKTDNLRNKAHRLETELHEKNIQCAKFRDELREQETKSTQGSSASPSQDTAGFMPVDGGEINGGGKLNEFMSGREENLGSKSDFMLMESGFSFQENDINDTLVAESLMNESMSTRSADLGSATKWLQDFEDGKSVFSEASGAKTEPSPTKTTRSTERDKVRSYVRKRYLKRNGDTDKNKAIIK
jgi:chromosome segregation ATPase